MELDWKSQRRRAWKLPVKRKPVMVVEETGDDYFDTFNDGDGDLWAEATFGLMGK